MCNRKKYFWNKTSGMCRHQEHTMLQNLSNQGNILVKLLTLKNKDYYEIAGRKASYLQDRLASGQSIFHSNFQCQEALE